MQTNEAQACIRSRASVPLRQRTWERMEGGVTPPFPSIRSRVLENAWERMGTEGTDRATCCIRRAGGVAFVARDLRDVLRALGEAQGP